MKYNIILTSAILILLFVSGCSNSLDTNVDTAPSTTIAYHLPDSTHVELWIENAYKTRVVTLVDEVQSAGTYHVDFEAVDDQGNTLPPGIYFYFLKTDDNSASRYMILSL